LFIAAGLYPAFFFYSLGCHPSFFSLNHKNAEILSLFQQSGTYHPDKDEQQTIYELIKNNGSRDPLNEPLNEPLNTERIASLLNIPYSTTKQIIKELEQLGRIIRIGSKKTGYWEAIDVLRVGDFAMLKNPDHYTSTYINKLNLFDSMVLNRWRANNRIEKATETTWRKL
jgi:hypothetical protein